MKKLQFSTTIHAPAEKVWQVLWTDETYRQWTSVFAPGSHAVSDWKQGSRIQFLDGKGGGMFSIIEESVPTKQMTFKHLGDIKDGVETPSTWAGSRESYRLQEENSITRLQVSLDSVDEFENYFEEVFPKALEKVKQLAEA